MRQEESNINRIRALANQNLQTKKLELSDQENTLRAYQKDWEEPLISQLQKVEQIVTDANNEIVRLQQRQNTFNGNILNATSFLNELNTNPKNLFETWLQKIKTNLNQYDKEHTTQAIHVSYAYMV
jgi:hypothetical protein